MSSVVDTVVVLVIDLVLEEKYTSPVNETRRAHTSNTIRMVLIFTDGSTHFVAPPAPLVIFENISERVLRFRTVSANGNIG